MPAQIPASPPSRNGKVIAQGTFPPVRKWLAIPDRPTSESTTSDVPIARCIPMPLNVTGEAAR